MTLYVIESADESEPVHVRVLETPVGKGVFAVRAYPATAIIGRINGRLMDDPGHSSEYSFECEHGQQLEPDAPFRYVNHSCDPNCEFDLLEESQPDGVAISRHLYLIALCDIAANEQFTIEYNWSAACAIPCKCGAKNCVGWIVCAEELSLCPPSPP